MAQKKIEIQEVIESLAGITSYVYITQRPSLSLCIEQFMLLWIETTAQLLVYATSAVCWFIEA